MKILILNWRDIRNPNSGGAEILTHELAKGWVSAGNEVLVFSSSFLGAKENETIDGVRFVRRGRWWNVHVFAFFYYIFRLRKRTDIIVDEVHWFPFFAAAYAKKKTIALTCEVANKLLFTIFPAPIAHIFRIIERTYLLLYKNVPTLTISESTKKDLIREGINANLITVLKLGIHVPKNTKTYQKEKNPTFLYLARLNKQKGIYDAIEAFFLIKKSLRLEILDLSSSENALARPKTQDPRPNLWVVGSGEEDVIKQVKRLAKEYGIQDNVKFFGFVSDVKKYELLRKAHLLLVPSAQEGWGLTVIEAGRQGTPAVACDVEGLRDSIVDKKTGILTEPTPEALAKEALKLVTKKQKYAKLSKGAREWSRKFDWKITQKKSLEVLDDFYRKKK